MKTKLILLVLLLSCGIGFAQQDAQYTHYMYNTNVVNPAYAGSRDVLSVFGLHRTQWVGLAGAPVTSTVSVSTPLNGTNLGLGVSIVNDKIGPSDENNIAVDLSYFIPTSDRYRLSFGIKATANLLNVDFTKLDIYNPADARFANNIDNRFSPNIGAGLFLHSDKTYFGLSVPNFIETEHFDKAASNLAPTFIATERLHYYIIAGHVFDISGNVKFKPSLLSKVVKGSPLQLDLSGNFLINDKFTAGVAYRWDAAMSGLLGFQVNESWLIGYSYDFETTRLARYNSGSHEIFLRYELFKKNNKVISPRFF